MKAFKIILIVLYLLILGVWAYQRYFAKMYEAYTRVNRVKTGMTRQQVVAVMAAPDTIYREAPPADSLLVMRYDMGFGALSALRVFLHHDTVTTVTYRIP